MSETLDTSSVIQAVNEAVKTHGKPEILNSDQGCQFTSNEYKKMLKDLEITQSMDGKARWADNIMIERWFRSLKVENIYTNEYLTPRSLRQGISAYIEQYNTLRPHEALGYKTPSSIYFADLDSQPATQATAKAFTFCIPPPKGEGYNFFQNQGVLSTQNIRHLLNGGKSLVKIYLKK